MEENNIYESEEKQEYISRKNKGWTKYAAILILAGFAVPVVGMIYDNVPKILIAAAAAVLLILIIKAACERDRSISVMRAADPEKTETCSDIKSVRFDLSGGTFVINTGVNFSINGTDEKHFNSYVKNGVWHFESVKKTRKINPSADSYPITISLPQNFNAEKASVSITGGKILIYSMSAYSMAVSTDSGETDIRNMYAQKLDLRCSSSNVRANAMTNGDINITCLKGRLGLNLGCYADSVNCAARVRGGKVTVGDKTAISENFIIDNRAAKRLNINCENGETVVTFRQEAVNND